MFREVPSEAQESPVTFLFEESPVDLLDIARLDKLSDHPEGPSSDGVVRQLELLLRVGVWKCQELDSLTFDAASRTSSPSFRAFLCSLLMKLVPGSLSSSMGCCQPPSLAWLA